MDPDTLIPKARALHRKSLPQVMNSPSNEHLITAGQNPSDASALAEVLRNADSPSTELQGAVNWELPGHNQHNLLSCSLWAEAGCAPITLAGCSPS